MMIRRPLSVFCTLLASSFLALPAGAQQECPSGPAYPPSEGSLTLSRTVVAPGETITVSGSGFAPNTTVTVSLEGAGATRVLTTFQSDSQGSFSGPVTIPSDIAPGSYRLTASGASTCVAVVRVLGARFTVRAAAAAQAPGPRTGTDLMPWVAIAAGVIVVGGIFLIVARRRSGEMSRVPDSGAPPSGS